MATRTLTPVLAAALALATAGAAAQQPPTFKSGTQIVSLFVTVQDAQKRLVANLTQNDFEVFDNDKPVAITYFDSSLHPINVVAMLDTSGSMTLTIDLLKQAAEQFVLRLLPDDKARVGAFNDKIQFGGSPFTNNRDEIVAVVRKRRSAELDLVVERADARLVVRKQPQDELLRRLLQQIDRQRHAAARVEHRDDVDRMQAAVEVGDRDRFVVVEDLEVVLRGVGDEPLLGILDGDEQ